MLAPRSTVEGGAESVKDRARGQAQATMQHRTSTEIFVAVRAAAKAGATYKQMISLDLAASGNAYPLLILNLSPHCVADELHINIAKDWDQAE